MLFSPVWGQSNQRRPKMNFRTDLAIEAREFLTEKEIPGITSQDSQIGNVQVSTIQVHSQEAAHRLHKPIGTYITITVGGLFRLDYRG